MQVRVVRHVPRQRQPQGANVNGPVCDPSEVYRGDRVRRFGPRPEPAPPSLEVNEPPVRSVHGATAQGCEILRVPTNWKRNFSEARKRN